MKKERRNRILLLFLSTIVVFGSVAYFYQNKQRSIDNLIREEKEAVYAAYAYYLNPSSEKKKRMIREKGDVQLIDDMTEELDFNDLEKTKKYFHEKGYIFHKEPFTDKESYLLGKLVEEGEIEPPIVGKRHTFKYYIFEERIRPFREYGLPKGRRALAWIYPKETTIFINHTICYNNLKWIWGNEHNYRRNNKLVKSGKKEAIPMVQLVYTAYNPFFQQARKSIFYNAKRRFLKLAYEDLKERVFIHEAAHKHFGPGEYFPRLSELFYSPSHSTLFNLMSVKGFAEKILLQDFIKISGVGKDKLYTLTKNQLRRYARELMKIKIEEAKKNIPSFRGIQIGDPIEKAMKILGKPTKIKKNSDTSQPGTYYSYESNGKKYEFSLLGLTTSEGKIGSISIFYSPPIPYEGIELEKKGYLPHPDHCTDHRVLGKFYSTRHFGIFDIYGWHKGASKGPYTIREIRLLD
jgi:hypothetical protein